MIDQSIVVYCICDEVCKVLRVRDDIQCKMTTAEIMTFAIYAASACYGDYKRARLFVSYQKMFMSLLSYSRLIQRIHSIPDHLWMMVFQAMQVYLRNPQNQLFVVDSFPVKAYENHKSFRAQIFSGKEYHGYSASRKQYFFGIKVHMVVDTDGIPLEFSFTPASHTDISACRNLTLALDAESTILADSAYTDYDFEDTLLEIEQIRLLAKRRKNLKRQHTYEDKQTLRYYRNCIETVFSSITSRMPRSLRVKTEKGFCLKVLFFVLAYMAQKACPLA